MKHETKRGKYDLDGMRCGLMCGGGGGKGGDGGAAERERQRQARIDQATAAINDIFGAGAERAMLPTGEKRVAGYQRPVNVERQVAGGRDGQRIVVDQVIERISPEQFAALPTRKTGRRFGWFGGDLGEQVIASMYSPIYEDVLADQVTPSGKAKLAREALYNQVRDDTNDYYTQQLAENSDEAARQLRFQQARQGTMGSSQQIDKGAEFQKRYDRGLLEVANRADAAATGMRSNDEQTRMSLLSKIAAGMDQASAMSSAHAQLASNADMARQNAMSGQMANVFSDLFAINNAAAAAEGQRKAQREFADQFGAFFANNKSENGKVTSGG